MNTIRVEHEALQPSDARCWNEIVDVLEGAEAREQELRGEVKPADRAILDASWCAKVQYAVAHAVAEGLARPGSEASIEVVGLGDPGRLAGRDAIEIIRKIRSLWEEDEEEGEGRTNGTNDHAVRFTIGVEREHGIWADPVSAGADMILRRAWLPVTPLWRRTKHGRPPPLRIGTGAKDAIEWLMQRIMRKRKPREGQIEAVEQILRGEDCVALLPTGGGKSLIYQLGGLLRLGITLYVTPLIALSDDQRRGLARYGIERVVEVNSTQEGGNRAALARLAGGRYQVGLTTPEALQSEDARHKLNELANGDGVALAVVDEAHCVSEWGHDFRPSYLSLGRTIRRYCRLQGGAVPPVLALTGTASRHVRREMLAALEMDTEKGVRLVLPRTFRRDELRMEIIRARYVDNVLPEVSRAVGQVAGEIGELQSRVFSLRGSKTSSGIVFTLTVNGGYGGVEAVRRKVQQESGAGAVIYCGRPPTKSRGSTDKDGPTDKEWNGEKAESSRRFIENESPIMVTTKAFGMGIDKPNVRWTVHVGMPGSLESLYQETGRAGRDKREAYCAVIFRETDAQENEAALSVDEDLAVLDRVRDRKWEYKDDTSSALYFHRLAFPGAEKERKKASDVRHAMGDESERAAVIRWEKLPRREGEGEDDRAKGAQHVAHWLRVLGIVEDYWVNRSEKTIRMELRRLPNRRQAQDQALDRLREQARHSLPGQEDRIRHNAATRIDNGEDWITVLLDGMIELRYRAIEPGRRRMIQEAMRVGRECRTNEQIQRRVMAYLEEGRGSARLRELMEEVPTVPDHWTAWTLHEDAQDAEHMRGIIIRELEQFATHPGLLLARAVSELRCTNGRVETSIEAIVTARRHWSDYALSEPDWERVLDELWSSDLAQRDELRIELAALTAAEKAGGKLGSWQHDWMRKHENEIPVAIMIASRVGRHADRVRRLAAMHTTALDEITGRESLT